MNIISKIRNKYKDVTNGNLIPLRIHVEELPKDLEKEKTFKI